MDDGELIDAFIDGDEQAFNKIVLRYNRQIYAYVRRMVGSHEDADDLAQETFVKAYRGLHRFRRESSLETWLTRIAINLTLNHLRRNKWISFLSLGAVFGSAPSHEQSTEERIEKQEEKEIVRKCVDKLPPKQKTVFILRCYEEKSFKEIAGLTGISENGAKSNYHHAVVKIKKIIEESGLLA